MSIVADVATVLIGVAEDKPTGRLAPDKVEANLNETEC
jgi:hypothetical protein